MALIISPAVRDKLLAKHRVTPQEVEECFLNREGGLLTDDREEHRTDPPTQWFISHTDHRRELKVIFIERGEDIYLRSAYAPEPAARALYRRYWP